MDLSAAQKKELRTTVANGVAWFTETQPTTWRQDIRTTIDQDSPLEMNHCERCMMSRYFGSDYFKGLTQAQPKYDDAQQMQWGKDHGFDLPEQYDAYPYRYQLAPAWRYLEELWMAELCKEAR